MSKPRHSFFQLVSTVPVGIHAGKVSVRCICSKYRNNLYKVNVDVIEKPSRILSAGQKDNSWLQEQLKKEE